LFEFKTAAPGGGNAAARRSVTPSRSSAQMDSQPPTTTTNIHTIVKAQIVFLLSTLTEENFDRNQIEIRSVRLVFPFSPFQWLMFLSSCLSSME
jgi:hypothetical protein